MRVAFIVTSFPHPSSTPVLKQIAALIERGHEVDIYGDRPGDPSSAHPDIKKYDLLARTHYAPMPPGVVWRFVKGLPLFLAGVTRHPRAMFGSLNVFRYRQLAGTLVLMYGALPLLDKRRYDVIHGQSGPNGVKALFFREHGLLEGKLVTTFRGYDVTSYPRRWGRRVYERLFRKGDLFTANSRFLVDRALELGCPSDRLIELHTGVDLSRFAFRVRKLAPGEPVRILTVGSLVEVKGVEYGIRAIAKLVQTGHSVRHQIIGHGPLLVSLQHLARQLGIADRVEFLGAQAEDRVRQSYADAHLFLLPGVVSAAGDEEGQGGVLAEAQATGLPVVATRVGGIPQAVLEGRSGLLVAQKDPDALAEALTRLIDRPERWAEMGRAGRRHIEAYYDLEEASDRLAEIYQRLLDRPRH